MNKKVLGASVLGLCIGAAAAGVLPSGYIYGLQNCGPAAGVQTRLACKQCCRRAYLANTLDYDQWQDCRDFCDDANFPSLGRRLFGNWIATFLGGTGPAV